LYRKRFLLGLLFLISTASVIIFVDRTRRHRGGQPRTTRDYIDVSARITTGMPYRTVLALVGKPTSDEVTAGAGVDPKKLTPAQFKAARRRYTDWYIGREGEGDFWPTVYFYGEPPRQTLAIIFDRDDRVVSKGIYTEGRYIYDD
jgi:hypothetical protein